MNLKANVLIDQDGHARLTDFGLASTVLGNQSVVGLPDTSQTIATTWAAPEISEGGPVTKAGDVFAFAMVVAEVRERGFLEKFLTNYSHRTDVYGASSDHGMLRYCVNRGAP